MYLSIIFLTIIGSCFAGFFGKQLGSYSKHITIMCIFLALLCCIFVLYEVALIGGSSVYLLVINWFDSDTLTINWGLMFDSLTAIMCLVVTFISFLVHCYSLEYMAHDPHVPRFMSYLSLFTFFMLILITSDNFVQMFVGWEGVGLCSYLLINFWFTRIQANKAAIKAMIINRIGDFALVLGILIIFIHFKSVDYATLSVLLPFFKKQPFILFFMKFSLVDIICIFLFIGAVGKSAQIGLHTWLPDAMEGPTPVSALIHAATMVTAGVFLIARSSFIFDYSLKSLEYLLTIGAVTAFMAASIGLVQNDLKKVIAYSTCSQLGYMVFACGLSNYYVAVFHLTNHAFFKALLFLSAGSIIHSVNDEQDMRKMGGLKNLLPFTYLMIICGSLALIGFPFLTGFYSKDFILETAFGKRTMLSYFSYYLGTIGAFCTAFYSTRLFFLTFLSKPNGYKKILCYAVDSNSTIKIVLSILAIPSVFIGYLFKDLIIGIGSNFFQSAIFFNAKNLNIYDAEFVPIFYKTLPVHFSLIGVLLAFFIYAFYSTLIFKLKLTFLFKKFYIFLNKKWYFDKIYNEVISSFFFNFSYSISYKFIDRGLFEILGPTGLSNITLTLSSRINKIQTNLLYHLVLMVFVITNLFFIIEMFQCFLLINQYFLNFYNEYYSIYNYVLCSYVELFSFELLLLNLIILTVIYRNRIKIKNG